MTNDIRKHLATRPFTPFTIRTTDGEKYPVPTIDHIWLPPNSGRVAVAADDGTVAFLSGLHIAALITQTPANGGSH
jgi:hypothetical protein